MTSRLKNRKVLVMVRRTKDKGPVGGHRCTMQ